MIPASRALTRLLIAACAAALAALAIALAGCGGDSAASADGTVAAATGTKASAKVDVDVAAGGKRCKNQVGAFLGALDLLRERLVAGLSYEQYVAEIEQVRTSYDAVPVDHLTLRCVANAGTPGEQAFDKYIEAANAWGECIGESGCNAATVEPVLQKQWRVAAHFLDEAGRGLRL